MRATYDPETDAAYIYLTGDELSPGRVAIPAPNDGHDELPRVILDFKDGRLVGVEVLGAEKGLHADLLRIAERA